MSIAEQLGRHVLQFDGGFGSQLTARGVAFDCPERLNLSHPETVRAIHRAYVEAGAEIVETNTLGANAYRLAAHGLADEGARIVEAAIGHVRAAGAQMIACSMGTTAEFMEPAGTLTLGNAVECFAAQARAAAAAGADVLYCETLTDLAEARAMWMAAREAGLPFAASFTFMQNGRTMTGSPPEACAITAWRMGAELVGVNCVGEEGLLLDVLRRMRAVCPLPVVVQPNAGQPEKRDGALHYSMTPEAMVSIMRQALSDGAGAIGGCCGTTPEHIRAMAQAFPDRPAPSPGGDGVERICSLRNVLPLREAVSRMEEMTPQTLDDSEADAVLLDLRGISPADARELLAEAQLLLKQPLLLRANDAETLEAALRAYAGIAGIDAPFAAEYGAIKL